MAIGNENQSIRFREAIIPAVPVIHYVKLAGEYGKGNNEMAIDKEFAFLFLAFASIGAEAALVFGATVIGKENPALGILAYGAGRAALAGGVALLDR